MIGCHLALSPTDFTSNPIQFISSHSALGHPQAESYVRITYRGKASRTFANDFTCHASQKSRPYIRQSSLDIRQSRPDTRQSRPDCSGASTTPFTPSRAYGWGLFLTSEVPLCGAAPTPACRVKAECPVEPIYRGTSLIRNTAPLGPYSRTLPRDL